MVSNSGAVPHVSALHVSAALAREFHAYPQPPSGFTADLIVSAMWERFRAYREGREPLASMAYLCLTLLEGSASLILQTLQWSSVKRTSKRKEAVTVYRIDKADLDKLGELTSAVGDLRTGRKFGIRPKFVSRPHTQQEIEWIEGAVRRMIRRVGEYANSPALFDTSNPSVVPIISL